MSCSSIVSTVDVEFSNSQISPEKSENYLHIFVKYFLDKIEENLETDLEVENPLSQFFESEEISPISLHEYIEDFQFLCQFSNSTLKIAVILVERFLQSSLLTMNILNCHRIVMIALVISAKFNEDDITHNLNYSKIARMELDIFNKLEKAFLKSINFWLFVDEKEITLLVKRITTKK
jgi:hypothetical protein